MLQLLNGKFRRLFCRFRLLNPSHPKPKILVKSFRKTSSEAQPDAKHELSLSGSASVYPNGELGGQKSEKPIRIATFNAALFSMAPAVSKTENEKGDTMMASRVLDMNLRSNSANDRPKSILKKSPLYPNSTNGTDSHSNQQKSGKSKLRVSINLPDNEISLLRSRHLSFHERGRSSSSSSSAAESSSSKSRILRGEAPSKSTVRFPKSMVNDEGYGSHSHRTVLEVLRELDADILALQDVKAEEEKAMNPLSDLAAALGMNYAFAESWAPEYGNAILSRWPIKRWKAEKIFDDSDFRNVLKATIDVPHMGEVNFSCTLLDHLDENWRMKQINAIIQASDEPHILAGGLNSLDETDYSPERWTDIVKYYEEIGKPRPKVEVMRFLKSKQYTDAKDFAGECEPVVMIAKGQSVQGTCKYGTRVDYVLASQNSPYKFVPGSYTVFSSKGTSDHHIVKVDLVKEISTIKENVITRKQQQPKQKFVKITKSSSSNGIWRTHTLRERY
ncbi:hypothetical protein F2P56_018570 [Juglans regia]|uniref:Endonuclease/exonuclease/phosphatase domain-containing protein n=2 Tax=Juglans regia TaxID=51240 RepID=A0A833X6I9_JUGRE|nr:uncharacterized protein LOC108994499 [Juglans regia]KAF5462579.1 hypothetical protein F2P56_018570 [Juglans regia]